MQRPDFSTRVKILEKKADQSGYAVPRTVIEVLAAELTDDIRQLESGLNGLVARSSLLGSPIDADLAEAVVENVRRRQTTITVGSIKKLVCKYYHVTPDQLASRSRRQAIVIPRQVAMFLARRYTDQSLAAIGRSFNRYHATALHAISAVERHIRQQTEVQRQVEFLCERLESQEH